MIDCYSGKSDDAPKEDLNGKLLDMYSSIYTMRQDLERIKKPQGSKENPVRSCKDLYFGHPQFKDGNNVDQHLTYKLTHIRKLTPGWTFVVYRRLI